MTASKTPSGNGKAQPSHERALARLELKRELAKATSARKRLDLLISHKDAGLLVPTMPAEELYFTIKEVGLSDSVELVQLASPAQFRTFLDLDGWKREQLDAPTALLWIRAARTDSDEERFRKKLHLLDMEVIELLLKNALKIWDLQEDEDPQLQGISWRSPEGRYMVEFLVEGTEYIGVKELLDELYAEDPFRAVRLLEAVRWEMATELEETAFRWRNARLADLGFPDLAEALSYFAYADPDAALPELSATPAVPEGFFLSRVATGGRFLDKAAALLGEAERDLLERQLVTVFNAAMVVEGVDPGELDAVSRVLASARDTLSLGLEYASKGDPAKGAALLAGAPLKRVFQIGASVALRLKFRADRLMRSGKSSLPGTRETPLFDSPIGEVIVALRRKRPLYCEALDDSSIPPTRLRAFRDRSDVARVADVLAQAERLADAMAALGFDPKKTANALLDARGADLLVFARFSELYLSAVARTAVGETFAFEPLPKAKLGSLAKQAFTIAGETPSLTPEFEKSMSEPLRSAAKSLSAEHLAAADAFLQACRTRMIEEAGRPLAGSGSLNPELPLPFVIA